MTEQHSANWKDGLIRARDGLLDRVTGVTPDQVLNAAPYQPSQTESIDLAAELKMAMDEFKIAAMDEDGYQVNYARLRESKVYALSEHPCIGWIDRVVKLNCTTGAVLQLDKFA